MSGAEAVRRVRLFLDANVLVSVSWKDGSKVSRLWSIPGVELITSNLVVLECERNLNFDAQRERLREFLASVVILHFDRIPVLENLPPIAEKDRHVLSAAVLARADYLVTGDRRHFGAWYGKEILRLRIEPPGRFPDILDEH